MGVLPIPKDDGSRERLSTLAPNAALFGMSTFLAAGISSPKTRICCFCGLWSVRCLVCWARVYSGSNDDAVGFVFYACDKRRK